MAVLCRDSPDFGDCWLVNVFNSKKEFKIKNLNLTIYICLMQLILVVLELTANFDFMPAI